MPDDVIKKIFTVNLGVKRKEKVLVFTDTIRPDEKIDKDEKTKRLKLRDIASRAAALGKDIADVTYIEYPSVKGHGQEPPVELWETAFGRITVTNLKASGLLDRVLSKTASQSDLLAAERIIKEHADSPNAVVALSNYSTSHTRFRDYLTRCMNARYASMPLFEESMLTGAMTADWGKVRDRTERLVSMFAGADMVYITSHNGTSIGFSVKDRKLLPDTGILTELGAFGNLPAGEAFLAPVEGTAQGILILEWAPTRKLTEPIELVVKDGLVCQVYGADPFAVELREALRTKPLLGNIAELGIGTNDRASRPDNILETEKILGTVHIALGDNSSFGGKVSVPFHQDFIFFKPTLKVVKGEEKIEVIVDGVPRFC